MLTPVNEYYTSEEHQYALKMMRRSMEQQRIIMQAHAIVSQKESNLKAYKNLIQEKANQTKNAITKTKGQLDSAIKGAAADKINSTVDALLTKYDNII